MDSTKVRAGGIVGVALVAVLTLALARKRIGATAQSEPESPAEHTG